MALDPEVASINDDCILKFTVRAAENCGLGPGEGSESGLFVSVSVL